MSRFTAVRRALALAAISAVACPFPVVNAATWYWNTTTTGLWTNGANWSNNPASGGTTGTVPANDTTADIAYFNQSSVNGTQTVQLNADRSITGIVVANTGATTIASDGVTPRLLTLGGGGLTVLSTANNLTLGGASNPLNIAIAASQTFANNASSRTLTVVGGISRTAGDTTSRTLTIDGAGSTALQGVVSDGGASGSLGLTKSGTGQLTLSAANTYSGATTVNTGTLRLDFSATGAPTANIVNNTSNSSGLTLGGGALSVVGKASTSNSQQFNGLTLNRGANSIVGTIGVSGTVNVALGAVTRSVAGGVVNFTLPTTGTISTTTANANFSGGQQTILGGYATVGGTTWAVSAGDGTNPGAITGLATYNSGFSAGTDVDVAGGASAPASMTVNSLRFNAASVSTVSLGGPLTVATGGILVTTTTPSLFNAHIIQNSTITSGNGADLIVHQAMPSNTGAWLRIASQITGNIGFTKTGAGLVRLTGSNTYTGTTNVLTGVLAVGDNVFGNDFSSISPSSTIYVAQGATFQIDRVTGYTTSTATQGVQFGTITGEGNFGVSRGGTVILNAANTYAGTTTVNTGVLQVSSIGSWSTGNTTASNLGSPTTSANGLLTLNTGVLRYVGTGESTNRDVLGTASAATGTFTIEQAGSGSLVFTGTLRSDGNGAGSQVLQLQGSTAGTGEIAGTIVDKTSSTSRFTAVTKAGTGTWRLSGTTNTYTGVTTINGGLLEVVSLANGGALSSTGTSSNAAANLVIDGGTLRYVGAGGSSDRNFTTGTNGGTIDASGSGALTLSGSSAFVVSNTAARLTFTGTSTAANTFSGILGDNGTGKTSLTKAGAGTWILTNANTYTGTTSINAGQLQIGSAGTINGSARVTIAGGEFRYNSATALSAPVTFTAGTISGTGTIGTPVTVGTSDVLSPGNSPGSQSFTSGLTFASGGSYLWEINNWSGSPGTNYDQLVVSGSALDITATSGSKFTVAVTGLTAGNVAGVVPGFSPGTTGTTFTIATSSVGITGVDTSKFSIDTSAFTNNNTLPANAGFWLSTNGGSTSLFLNYAPSATYNLSAAASATAIRVGGTSTITATVTSSTASLGNPDSMAFTGLALSGSLGTLSSTSGTLAGGASGSGNAAFTTLATGSYTFTPSLTSATNVNIGLSANAGTTSGATVTVYNPASATSLSVTTVVLGNVHVGGSFGTQSLSFSNTGTAAAAFQEGLAGSVTGTTGGATGSGAFGNLFTGSASTAISVGLGNASTATAGVKSGTVTLGFTSTGTTSSGATGLSPLTLASQSVAVTGTVFNYAAANSISGTVNLGTVLKGTSLSQALSITNTAPNDGFSEKLDAAFGTLTGGVTTNAGSVSLLAAGGTSTAMSLSLASGSAGTSVGSAQVNFTSNGLGTSGLGTTSLGSQTVSLTATVLDPAVASFTSGSATTSWLLDFGSVQQNASVSPLGFDLYNLMQTSDYTADLALLDILSGTGNTGAITTTLPSSFNNLAAGSSFAYTAAFSTSTLGAFQNVYTLRFKSANGGTVFGGDTTQTLALTVQGVIIVPEPRALALAGIGITAVALAATRRQRNRRAARRKSRGSGPVAASRP